MLRVIYLGIFQEFHVTWTCLSTKEFIINVSIQKSWRYLENIEIGITGTQPKPLNNGGLADIHKLSLKDTEKYANIMLGAIMHMNIF